MISILIWFYYFLHLSHFHPSFPYPLFQPIAHANNTVVAKDSIGSSTSSGGLLRSVSMGTAQFEANAFSGFHNQSIRSRSTPNLVPQGLHHVAMVTHLFMFFLIPTVHIDVDNFPHWTFSLQFTIVMECFMFALVVFRVFVLYPLNVVNVI